MDKPKAAKKKTDELSKEIHINLAPPEAAGEEKSSSARGSKRKNSEGKERKNSEAHETMSTMAASNDATSKNNKLKKIKDK
jgi:hypothetical protein